jgi:hypothetical protein
LAIASSASPDIFLASMIVSITSITYTYTYDYLACFLIVLLVIFLGSFQAVSMILPALVGTPQEMNELKLKSTR